MSDIDKMLGLPEEPPDDLADAQQTRVDQFRRRSYSVAGLADIPAPVPLVDGWLAEDTLVWLYGERGHMKSLVALDLAGAVSSGRDWHGFPVKQAPVLYCALEGASGLYVRARVWEDYHDTGHGATFLLPRPPLQIIRDQDALGSYAAELDAGLVIIDTQNRATVGLDENSNVDMGRMIAALDVIREQTRACILVVHHAGIGQQRPRGHGSIDGAATAMIRVAKDGRLVKVANPKQREAEATGALLLNVTTHRGSVVLVAPEGGQRALTDSEGTIRRCLADLERGKGDVTHAEIKRAALSLGLTEGGFNYWLGQMVRAGTVEKRGRHYYLTNPAQGTLLTVVEDPQEDE